MSVTIRTVEESDLKYIYECYNNQEFNSEHLYYGYESYKYFQDEYNKTGFFSDSSKRFVILSACSIVGMIVINKTHPLMKLYELGFWIFNPTDRNKGYCREAIALVLKYFFYTHNDQRIQSITDEGNEAGRRVLEITGFKCEGIMRRAVWSCGKYEDCCLYSITKSDWEAWKRLKK